ncbi:class A beta-lactamase [Amycolatopsis sp. FDAARGOS 1241]|uniref:class A beta-lactamase n=1 Tax=Amycolatopsis sp. FDAARGOS 1241 TaxID=2778070 RepID=UPI001951BEF6|nr:class A beta-lactamase [Amycolatopsis sp. FDAARGOS 1241]
MEGFRETADADHFRRGISLLRKTVPLVALALLAGCAVPASPQVAPPTTPSSAAVSSHDFADVERTFGARLGVYALDTGSGREVAYRADERFAYASTHKVFSSAAVLKKLGVAGIDRVVKYTQADVVSASPITSQHVADGMTLRAVMDAALRYSDNTGANLLFRELGGPPALGSWLSSIGDRTTHVDRTETTLNESAPGDVRDTTTPRTWARDLRAVVLGSVLPPDARTFLTDTMRANTTGAATIRAGVPAGWQVADKTGTADHGTRNDIAITWPPGRAPIVLVVLSDHRAADATTDDALIARVTTAAVKALG